MIWQRRILSTGANVGAPGPLPAAFDGLTASALADLSAAIPYAIAEIEGGAYAGHGFFPVAAPPVVPAEVTATQFELALVQGGLWDQVTAKIEALPETHPLAIMWRRRDTFRRDNPAWDALAPTLVPPRTSADVDAVFIAASQIRA